jgi:hypothetical protein
MKARNLLRTEKRLALSIVEVKLCEKNGKVPIISSRESIEVKGLLRRMPGYV